MAGDRLTHTHTRGGRGEARDRKEEGVGDGKTKWRGRDREIVSNRSVMELGGFFANRIEVYNKVILF